MCVGDVHPVDLSLVSQQGLTMDGHAGPNHDRAIDNRHGVRP